MGIVKDTAVFAVGEPPQPVAYVPFDQAYQPFAVLHVRTSTTPRQVLPAVMAAVQSLDPDLALLNPVTMSEVIAQAL